MVIPHLKKLYIYDERDDDPIGVSIVGATTSECKLTMMNVEEVKWDEVLYKRLSSVEAKLMEQLQVIRALSNNILDLTSILEIVEEDVDARPEIQEESREAYM